METTRERGFLAENWPWILVPLLLVLGALAALTWMTGPSDEDRAADEFVYPVF